MIAAILIGVTGRPPRYRELEDVVGEAGAAGVVGHDGVGDEGPEPERGDLGLEGGVDGVEDEGRGEVAGRSGPLPGRSIRDRARSASGRPAP